MRRKVVAIDIDDVVADTVGAIIQNLSLRSDTLVTQEHFQYPGEYWGYYESLIERLGLGAEFTYDSVVAVIEANADSIFPMADAGEVIGRLSSSMDIVFITARHKDRENETKKWIEKHFAVSEENVHVIGNDRSGPLRTKGDVCKEIGADWLIDDNPEHCLSAIESGVEAILFGDYGWQHKAPDHLHRCLDWRAVERLLT